MLCDETERLDVIQGRVCIELAPKGEKPLATHLQPVSALNKERHSFPNLWVELECSRTDNEKDIFTGARIITFLFGLLNDAASAG